MIWLLLGIGFLAGIVVSAAIGILGLIWLRRRLEASE